MPHTAVPSGQAVTAWVAWPAKALLLCSAAPAAPVLAERAGAGLRTTQPLHQRSSWPIPLRRAMEAAAVPAGPADPAWLHKQPQPRELRADVATGTVAADRKVSAQTFYFVFFWCASPVGKPAWQEPPKPQRSNKVTPLPRPSPQTSERRRTWTRVIFENTTEFASRPPHRSECHGNHRPRQPVPLPSAFSNSTGNTASNKYLSEWSNRTMRCECAHNVRGPDVRDWPRLVTNINLGAELRPATVWRTFLSTSESDVSANTDLWRNRTFGYGSGRCTKRGESSCVVVPDRGPTGRAGHTKSRPSDTSTYKRIRQPRKIHLQVHPTH